MAETCPFCDLVAEIQRLGALENKFAVKCKRCGPYYLTEQGLYAIPQIKNRQLAHILSGYAREFGDLNKPYKFDDVNIPELAASPPPAKTVPEKLNRVLLKLSQRATGLNEQIDVNLEYDYPLGFLKSSQELGMVLQALSERGYIQIPSPGYVGEALHNRIWITIAGWERVEQLSVAPVRKSDQCFVAMWFADGMKRAFIEGIVPGIERSGLKPLRIDMVEHNGKIDDRIISEIKASGLVVADFTGQRGGVYFEAGYAMGLGIPVIWTCRNTDVEKLHFDTRQYNHIVWDENNLDDFAERLTNRIRAIMPTTR